MSGMIRFTPGVVSGKHLINPDNFEQGYIIDDDSWVNYWRNGPNSILGNRPGDPDDGWGHASEVLDDKGNAHGLWATLGWFAGLLVLTALLGFILALAIFLLGFIRFRAGNHLEF